MKAIILFSVGLALGLALRPLVETKSASDQINLGAAAPIRSEGTLVPQGKLPAMSEGAERGYPIQIPKH